ncbi:MAG: hypothetical protein ABIO99_10700 [Candidatus Limnocylindria bacterium]
MTHHENEGLIDKVKNALGMGGDHDEGHDHNDDRHDHAGHDQGTVSAVDPSPTAHDSADVANRPAGPDFGADDTSGGSIADPATVETDRRDV